MILSRQQHCCLRALVSLTVPMVCVWLSGQLRQQGCTWRQVRRTTLLGAVGKDSDTTQQHVLAAHHHVAMASQRMLYPSVSTTSLLHIWGRFLEDS